MSQETSARPETVAGTPPIVLLNGICKYFPGVIANENVTLDVKPGEIHALLGENGAGKSTLMNILTGIYQPDAGDIIIDGYQKKFASPVEAIASGIGMVHQHFKLVQAFTVAENIHLGWSETPRRASAQILEERTRQLAEKFNLAVRPEARVSDLSAGEQQRVEILRVLARQARVLILDEPTAVLTPAEARELFKALDVFRAAGNAVIFISHKLDEVLEISDRISILRGGRHVATHPTSECNHGMLARLMVGRDIVLADHRARAADAKPISVDPVLQLIDVSVRDDRGIMGLKNVTLELRAGEILGIAGVAGNGQRELSHVITGMKKPATGRVVIDGEDVADGNAAALVDSGIGHIPEDRLKSGLAPSLSIIDNAVLREYKTPAVGGPNLFRPGAAAALAKTIAAAADVAIPDFAMPVRNLSGGNQQRLVARREMRIATKVLVAAYPSRGLDVGAINTMLKYFVEMRDAGVAVILISEELEELLSLSDRISVLCEGEIMGTFKADEADMETIGLLMGGKQAAPVLHEVA